MMPIDSFRYVKNNQTSRNLDDLTQLYLPIIGQDGQALYLYFQSFFDNGSHDHKVSDILNHLQFGMPRLQKALNLLSAMGLVLVYQNLQGIYLIKLNSCLDREQFLANAVYRNLLESKIGQVAVKELMYELPADVKLVSKRFSDIFGHLADENGRAADSKPAVRFDLDSFKQSMMRDGLTFKDERTDVIDLYAISERQGLNWFETYQLAKNTAIDNVIATKRMVQSQTVQKAQPSETFTEKEQAVIQEAKRLEAELFLQEIKQTRRAFVTSSERKLLIELAQMNFLDEVINIMVLYTLNKTKSANLNKPYLMKMANDFAYQRVATAEEAVLKMRTFAERKQNKAVKTVKPSKTNVPAWSNPDYKEETNEQEQAQLNNAKQQLLSKLRQGGD